MLVVHLTPRQASRPSSMTPEHKIDLLSRAIACLEENGRRTDLSEVQRSAIEKLIVELQTARVQTLKWISRTPPH